MCLLVFFFLAVAASAQAPRFTVSLDRTTITAGETATLSLAFEGGTPRQVPNLQAPPNLSIRYTGESRQFEMVNGRTSSSLTYSYEITALQPGDYIIPAIRAQVGNEVLAGQPLRLKVLPASAQPANPDGSSRLAFLRLIVSKETAYLGEPFPVEVQLYITSGEDLQMPQLEGDGFTFSKMPQPARSKTQLGNRIYNVLTFRTSAVAVKTGTLTLGPAQCSLTLHVPIGRRTYDPFQDFFGPRVQKRPIALTSNSATVRILPLPDANRPPDFNGAVGSYSIQASASPTNLAAGDPITLRVQIIGEGNLEALPFPGDTDWPEFKLYPPTSKTEPTDALGLSGMKTFERVVIPQNAGVKEIPAISFSFFDPEQRAYRTLESAPIPITIRPGAAAPVPTVLAGSGKADEPPPTRDIVHVKPHLGTITALQPPLVQQPWFLILQAFPFLAWLSALTWRKRRDNLENNPRLRRRLRVAETVRKGLKHLGHLAHANAGDEFFATVFRLLQEQLGERLDVPASAITEAVLNERLRGHAPDELVDRLHYLFQVCNQARYAPQPSTEELMDLVPQVEAALRALRQLPDRYAA